MVDKPILDGLTGKHLSRMRVGRRWWDCTVDAIPDGLAYKEVLKKYLSRLTDHVRAGRGLLFHGEYSTGKTGAAVIIAKATVMYGGTAFFVPTTDLSDVKIDGTMFDANQTIWQRMRSVNLLVLDDLGSEHQSEWAKSLVERIIRIRSDHQRVIIATTNRPLKSLAETYGPAMAVISSIMLPVEVSGKNWRSNETASLSREIMGGQ
jgi:DNA replication protein DnaC